MKTKKSIKAIDGLIDKYKKDQKMFEALMKVRWLLKAMGVIVALFVGLGATAQTGNKITLTLTAAGATDTTSLSNRINLKVDSLTRTTDSICYWVNGTKSCLLSPQLDTTSLSDRINLKLDSLTFAAAILDYIKLIDFKFVNLLDVDTAGKEDGDFVRYRAADSSYYLSGFPAVFELDSTDNGLVASSYAGIVPADSSFMLKRWTDSIYAAKATTIQISGGVGISATGGTQSLSTNRSWTIAADTGRATTQLVTGGGLTKVADSLGALITGGGGNLYTQRLATWEYWNEWMAVPTATTSGGNDLVVNATGTGSGAGMVATPSANRPGIVTLQTGSTATGRTSFYTNSGLNTIELGGGAATLASDLFVPSLSNGTDRFAFLFGFYDATTMNQTDGIYFLYDEGGVSTGSAASANWQCVTVSNSVRTFTTTSTAVSSTDFQRLAIEVNAAGTSVDFKIGGTTVATHTTNIPTGNSRIVTYGYQLIKSIGTNSRTVRVDWTYGKIAFTTSR